MTWLFNTYNPLAEDAKEHAFMMFGGPSPEYAWEAYQASIKDRIIGEPKLPPGSMLSLAEIRAINLVGVYTP